MNLYKYRYVDSTGMTLRGSVKAQSKTEALAKLQDVAELQFFKDCGTVVEMPAFLAKRQKLKKVDPKILVGFFDQLAYMISAGISIQKGLMIQQASAEGSLSVMIHQILLEMSRGKSFAQAFEACKDFMTADYSRFIYVGEKGGSLDITLERIAKQIQSSLDVKGKVKSALVYPVGVLVVALGASYFIFTTIIPQIADLLKDMGDGELPALTQITMAISDFLIAYGPFAILIGVAIAFGIKKAIHKWFQYQWDSLILRVPIFGGIIRTGQFITFYQNLSFMMDSGFSVAESFKVSRDSVENQYLYRQLSYAYEEIVRGRGLPQALSTIECVLPLEIQTIDVGISTGRIRELLDKLLTNMQKDMDALIKNLLSVLEPMMMLVLAGIVGVIMLSVYGPMFSMMSM